jgi:hypothetical protein
MRWLVRWFVIVLLTVHALIHLLGAAKGLGWAEVSQLEQPIGTLAGIFWLSAAALLLLTAAAMAVGSRWWWALAAFAAVVSQAVIVTSWSDASAGTAANFVVLLAAVYGFVSVGPRSLAAEWESRAQRAIARLDATNGLVTEADLSALPPLVAEHVRRSGAVGKPRVTNFSAIIHGRIRGGQDEPWMTFTGRQLNTYGSTPERLFLINAAKAGLPVAVLHVFDSDGATMRAKVLSLITVLDGSGPDADRAETVTLFNDLVLLAPSALINAPIRWTQIDDLRVRGSFTNGAQTVAADLIFSPGHELVDFISDDRLRSSPDGATFIRQRWSTPIRAYTQLGERRVVAEGEARWHAPAPEGEFTYLEFHLDDLTYNLDSQPKPTAITVGGRPHS